MQLGLGLNITGGRSITGPILPTVRQQIDGLAPGGITLAGRTSSSTLKIPGVDPTPAGVAFSATTVTILSTFNGDFADWNCGARQIRLKTGLSMGSVIGNIFGGIVVEAGARATNLVFNNLTGPYGPAAIPCAIQCLRSASLSPYTVGSIAYIGYNRVRGFPSDSIQPAGDTGGVQIIEYNDFGPGVNMPVGTVEYNAATSYDAGTYCRVGKYAYVALVANSNVAPATGLASNATWQNVNAQYHVDLLNLRGSIGVITFRRNRCDFRSTGEVGIPATRVVGLNNVLRISRNTGALDPVAEVIFDENVVYYDSVDAFPMQIAPGMIVNFTGPFRIRNNWMSPNGGGNFYHPSTDSWPTEWSGNVNAGTGAAVAAPNLKGASTAPTLTGIPTISGTQQRGFTLTAVPATIVGGTANVATAYRWKRDGVYITGATKATYVQALADVGATLTVEQTTGNGAGYAQATSAATGVIADNTTAPANTVAPTITGVAREGETLVFDDGVWTGTATITYERQLYFSDTDLPVEAHNDNASNLFVTSDLIDTSFYLLVTGTNGAGSATAQSSAIGPVAAKALVALTPPTISGIAQAGVTLTSTRGTYSGSPVTSYADQWLRGGVVIPSATDTSYTLVSADVGSTITKRETASNSAGPVTQTSAATATVITSLDDTYLTIVDRGQSGQKYAMTAEKATFNPDGKLRPTISGYIGQFVCQTTATSGGSPETPYPVSLNNGFVDIAANDTNFQTASGGVILSRGAAATLQFAKFLKPTQTPVVALLAVSGTGMNQEVDNTDFERRYDTTKTVLDYVEANYGKIDLIVHSWYGNEGPTFANYMRDRGLIWMGQTPSGAAHVQGNPNPDISGSTKRVDHYQWDVTATPGTKGRGLFTYLGADAPKLAFAIHPNNNMTAAARVGISGFLNDARISPMTFGQGHIVPVSGHIDPVTDYGQPLVALFNNGWPLCKVTGQNFQQPTITGYYAPTDGSYVEFYVSLPSDDATLTTTRAVYAAAGQAIPTPSPLDPEYTDIYGLVIKRPSGSAVAATRSGTGSTNTQGTFTIPDSGSGTGAARRARCRFTPVVPFQNNTIIGYLAPDADTYAGNNLVDLPFVNQLIAHVPSLKQSETTFFFPGFLVGPADPGFTLELTPPPPVPGNPTLIGTTWADSATFSAFETANTFTVPNEAGVLLIEVAYNSTLSTGSEPITEANFGTPGRAAGDGNGTIIPALSSLDLRSSSACMQMRGIQNPAAGTYTFRCGKSSGSFRRPRVTFIWVKDGKLPPAQSFAQGVGGSSTSITFAPTPTASSVLSIYAVVRNNASFSTIAVTGATQLDQGNGGTTSATNSIQNITAWAKHASTSAQSVPFSWTSANGVSTGGSAARCGFYTEISG